VRGTADVGAVTEALERLARGGAVVAVDDAIHRCQASLLMAAEHVTAADVGLFARHTLGSPLVALSTSRWEALELGPDDDRATSVDMETCTTGSAAELAVTIRALADPGTRPSQLIRPGHVVARCARADGVLGHEGGATVEAAVDLVRMAGCGPAAMTCELIGGSGALAGRHELDALVAEHGLPTVSVQDLVTHRYRTESLSRAASASLPTVHGVFDCVGYGSDLEESGQHLALVHGEVRASEPIPLFLHLGCLAGDVFRSRDCDCASLLDAAMATITEGGAGVIIYMRAARTNARLPVEAAWMDHPPASQHELGECARTLRELGVRKVTLLTGGRSEAIDLAPFGIELAGCVALHPGRSRGLRMSRREPRDAGAASPASLTNLS
jgi:3,4-dihydroxy 2-butanone 4-phosphate synthase / GTP cyclohydrolase II